jgi:hypothetical protein
MRNVFLLCQTRPPSQPAIKRQFLSNEHLQCSSHSTCSVPLPFYTFSAQMQKKCGDVMFVRTSVCPQAASDVVVYLAQCYGLRQFVTK